MSMRVTMPLAGASPPRKARQLTRDEERAFRMLSEGELFYVETDVEDHLTSSTRHDLGGVSLETIAAQQFGQPAAKRPSSVESRETAATSRTSSQDTQENDNNAWQQQQRPPPPPPPQQQQQQQHELGQRIMIATANLEPFHPSATRVSLQQAQEWDFHKKLEDIEASERRDRQRSCSEPQLSSMRAGAHQHKPQLDWHRRPQPYQQRWDTVNEGRSSAGWKLPTTMAAPSPPARSPRGSSGDPCADACAGLAAGIERAWSTVFGRFAREEEQQHAHAVGTLRAKSNPRVNSMCRNFASCTSTKTFESSPTYREALQRLGVDPQTSTFTMHVAGYRLVSTVLGMHAEYEVCVKGGGRRWSRWHRFSRFKTIASCTQADPDAAAAWARVLRAKPHFRCLNADYLALKCNLLEVFLQQVLFAMPTPAILIHFVSEK